MNSMEKKLAELVRGYPNLYNKTNQDYKDALKNHISWKEIASVMGKSEEEVKIKWKNLRDKYCKAKKRMARRRKGQQTDGEENQVERPVPALYQQLQWLNTYVKPRVDSSANKDEVVANLDDMETEQDKDKKDQDPPTPVVSTSFPLLELSPTKQQETSVSLKRKRQGVSETEVSSVDTPGTIRDEDELFLLSLLPSIKRLTIKKRIEVRMKFQQVLYAAEFED